MHRIKPIITGITTILTLSALVASMASAENTKMLPSSGGLPVPFTGTSGTATLTFGGDSFNCGSDTSRGEWTNESSGTVLALLKRCTVTFGFTCTGLGDEAETIKLEGTFHYWLYRKSETLLAAIVFLPKETHYECTSEADSLLVVVKGCVAGSVLPLEKLVTAVTIRLAGENGKQEIRKVLPQEGESESECVLVTSLDGGAFEESEEVMLEQVLGSIPMLLMN
jgi:hypothetical protein